MTPWLPPTLQHAHTYIHSRKYMQWRTHIRMHTCAHACVRVRMCVHACTHACTHTMCGSVRYLILGALDRYLILGALDRYLIFAILECVPDRQRTLRELAVGKVSHARVLSMLRFHAAYMYDCHRSHECCHVYVRVCLSQMPDALVHACACTHVRTHTYARV